MHLMSFNKQALATYVVCNEIQQHGDDYTEWSSHTFSLWLSALPLSPIQALAIE